MKIIFLIFLILFSVKAFSKSDSSYKTENVFLISYKDFNNEMQNLKDVRLISIDSISLSFEEVIYGRTLNENKYTSKIIVFDRIQKFGYKVGLSKGETIRNGALIGFGVGFILGTIEGRINIVGDGSGKPSGGERIGTGFLCGLALAIPAALLTSLFSLDAKEYETLDISKYSRQKKFEILKRLIRNGVKENE